MRSLRFLIGVVLAVASFAQTDIFPLSEVRAGIHATGKTVFAGDQVEDFDVEILGVMENTGPKQSIILARLSGGPLEKTGVLQGMSGSPVYVDGRLLGAVALSFPLTTEPLAGIRPIEEMLREVPPQPAQTASRFSLFERDLTSVFPKRREILTGGSRLVEIATPVSFSGFTRNAIEQFAEPLRALGLEPMQGLTGGGSVGEELGDPEQIRPGSMISVLLVSGDMSIGADGTVTHVDGDRVFAFGHRFLSVGDTELPFARSEVLTVAPNLSTSFKISASREAMGAITADYSTAVRGELGRQAELVPLSIRVSGPGGKPAGMGPPSYRMRLVRDRYLTPLLLQMAVFSAIDATERTLGVSSISVRGKAAFDNGIPPVRLDDMYAGEAGVPMQAALGTAIPLAYLLQSGFEAFRLKEIDLEVEVFNEARQWQIDQVWPTRREIHPGETAEINVVLLGENGAIQTHRLHYPVPIGAPEGTLHITVADAMTTNLMEYQHRIATKPRSPAQVISLLNELRSSTGAYARIWRADAGYQVGGSTLPAPPPSVALILGRAPAAAGGAITSFMSKVTELAIEVPEAVVSGSKTTQVEVKE